MKARPASLLQVKRWPGWLAGLLAAAGVLIFLVQALGYARTTASSLDEGAYLYKGYLFATRQYHPFELNGPQTNKSPLAFLIPGFVELIFGPGLRTGRSLAVVFGVLTVILVGWIAYRLAGKWLAAAAVWALALNPVLIKTYSEAVSQSEVAFTLALVLVLALGENRPAWQLALSGFLAGALIMIRQNMVVVLPLLVLYIWWQYGARKALYAALSGAAVLVFFHVLYWPYILQLWTAWMPDAVRSRFAGVYYSGPGRAVWNPSIDLGGRLLSVFQGMRFHFAAVFGFIFGLLLWPRKSALSAAAFRQAVFLAVLFASLLLMHSWAAIGNDYCVFCFTPYLAFFSLVGILLVCLLWQAMPRRPHPWQQALMALTVLLLSAGIAYSAVEDLGDPLLALGVPRLSAGRILPGSTTLGEMLANKFAWERVPMERIVSSAAGLALGALFLTAVLLLYWRLRRAGYGYGYVLGAAFLALGALTSPWLAGSAGNPDCSRVDVIRANEQVGGYLAGHIEPGKMTYWNGGLSVAPLLYAPQARIYLPQINDGYAFVDGGDARELLKYGLWNAELDSRWLAEADYIIVEGWRYAAMKAQLPPSVFDELPRSPAQTSCLEGSGLRFFQRK
jgi:4-amino-4-deoxy-L-arabinose transferase-like glycosyltransferase